MLFFDPPDEEDPLYIPIATGWNGGAKEEEMRRLEEAAEAEHYQSRNKCVNNLVPYDVLMFEMKVEREARKMLEPRSGLLCGILSPPIVSSSERDVVDVINQRKEEATTNFAARLMSKSTRCGMQQEEQFRRWKWETPEASPNYTALVNGYKEAKEEQSRRDQVIHRKLTGAIVTTYQEIEFPYEASEDCGFINLPPDPCLEVELAPEMYQKYVKPLLKEEWRCDAVDSSKIIPVLHVARMAQLIDYFPNGVTRDYFLDEFKARFGFFPDLYGYCFPKDSDLKDTFKLPFFWIPDYDLCGLPYSIIFPVKSKTRYGAFHNFLHSIWHRLEYHIINSKFILIDEDFDLDENEMFQLTGIRFNPERWGLTRGYPQLVEILHRYFDEDQRRIVTMDVPYKDDDDLLKYAEYMMPNYGESFVKALQQALTSLWIGDSFVKDDRIPFYKPQEEEASLPEPEPPIPSTTLAYYECLKRVTHQLIMTRPKATGGVVSAGSIDRFYMFHVYLVKDVDEQEKLLIKLHEIYNKKEDTIAFPAAIHFRMLIAFRNDDLQWRRGVVFERNTEKDMVSVIDVDTGEKYDRCVKDLRAILPEALELPVYAVPVRFALESCFRMKFLNNLEADEALGRSLHAALREPTAGMFVQFHKYDKGYSYITKGTWVITGYLMEILEGKPVQPILSLGHYLMRRYERGIIFPKRPRAAPGESRTTGEMRTRKWNIGTCIHFLQECEKQKQFLIKRKKYFPEREKSRWGDEDEFIVGPEECAEPLEKIFNDVESTEAIPKKVEKGEGIKKKGKSNIHVAKVWTKDEKYEVTVVVQKKQDIWEGKRTTWRGISLEKLKGLDIPKEVLIPRESIVFGKLLLFKRQEKSANGGISQHKNVRVKLDSINLK